MEGRDEKGRFVEGHPGGPGRPPGICLVTIIKNILSEMDAEEDRTVAEGILREYIEKARTDRDGIAIRDLIDRVNGKPTNKHEVAAEYSVHFDKGDEDY